MTAAAKEALDAIQKRDELTAQVQQEQEDPGELDPQEDNLISKAQEDILEVSASP